MGNPTDRSDVGGDGVASLTLSRLEAARGVGCGEEVGVQGAPCRSVWPCVIGAAMLCHDEHASLIRCGVVVRRSGVWAFVRCGTAVEGTGDAPDRSGW